MGTEAGAGPASGDFGQREGESVTAGSMGQNKWFGRHPMCLFQFLPLCSAFLCPSTAKAWLSRISALSWLSCLSSPCSDKWNGTEPAGASWEEESRADRSPPSPTAPWRGASRPREESSRSPGPSVPGHAGSRFISDVQELGGDGHSGRHVLFVYLQNPSSPTKKKKKKTEGKGREQKKERN